MSIANMFLCYYSIVTPQGRKCFTQITILRSNTKQVGYVRKISWLCGKVYTNFIEGECVI